jgi:hypothetical protein
MSVPTKIYGFRFHKREIFKRPHLWLVSFRMWVKEYTNSLLPDTDDTKKVLSQQYKTPVIQYKIQGATRSTVQDASSSMQDTSEYQVNNTRRHLFNTIYKGIPRQQYKTLVLQYMIQGATRSTVQTSSSTMQNASEYQVSSTRNWNSVHN